MECIDYLNNVNKSNRNLTKKYNFFLINKKNVFSATFSVSTPSLPAKFRSLTTIPHSLSNSNIESLNKPRITPNIKNEIEQQIDNLFQTSVSYIINISLLLIIMLANCSLG